MKLTTNNLKYFSVISIFVALAYGISQLQGAISPLFISLLFGLALVNTGLWGDGGREAASFAAKRCMRLGVVLLGFQISIDKFIEVGPKGLLAVVIIVAAVFLGLRYAAMKSGSSESFSTLIAVALQSAEQLQLLRLVQLERVKSEMFHMLWHLLRSVARSQFLLFHHLQISSR